MELEDIDVEAVFSELTNLFNPQFVELISKSGYVEAEKLFSGTDDFEHADGRQKAIAVAMRRARNRQILEVIFNAPFFVQALNELRLKLLVDWHEYFILLYMDKFDWSLTMDNVHQALDLAFLSRSSTVSWTGIEIFRICPKRVHHFSPEWELRPLMPEFLAGSSSDVHWIQGSMQTKWIPSQYELDNANGFLFYKSNAILSLLPVAADLHDQFMMLQLSPAVARSSRMYAIRENELTGEALVGELPRSLPILRLRLPFPQECNESSFIEDITWLLDHSRYLHDHSKAHAALQRYVLSINFFCSGAGDSSAYDDAVHDAVIGLETLLVGAQSEVNYRFQSIICRLIPEETTTARDVLKRLYNQRSEVAHQGRTIKPKTTHVDAFQAISLLNAAIRWYLKKAETMTEKEIRTYLDELPFSNDKDTMTSPWGTISFITLHPPQENGPWQA